MRHYSATIMYIVLISFRVLLHWPFSTLLLASIVVSSNTRRVRAYKKTLREVLIVSSPGMHASE